jgi:tetratricopeptide (TPR) repeat protein
LKAVNYNPLYAGAYNNLGIIYSSLNEYDKTLLYFTKGLKVDKNSSVSVENLSKLAELFLYRNEWEKAARCYEAIINLASNLEKEQRYKLLVKLAQLYYEKIKNFAKFENLCKRMIAEFPDYREPYVNLVKFYYLNSKYSKARKILDKLEERGLMDKEAERLKRLIS